MFQVYITRTKKVLKNLVTSLHFNTATSNLYSLIYNTFLKFTKILDLNFGELVIFILQQ